jgi:hypothetical protein
VTMLLISTGILVVVAAVLNTFMDISSENLFKQKWWNKGDGKEQDAWKNKWKRKDGVLVRNQKRLWYYLWLYKPPYKERFLYSTTIFVGLTDGWHFLQLIYNTCWQAAIAIHLERPILYFVMLKIAYSLVFQMLYQALKERLIDEDEEP